MLAVVINYEFIMAYANTVFPEPANIYVNIGAQIGIY